jgi:hypothetical protein
MRRALVLGRVEEQGETLGVAVAEENRPGVGASRLRAEVHGVEGYGTSTPHARIAPDDTASAQPPLPGPLFACGRLL